MRNGLLQPHVDGARRVLAQGAGQQVGRAKHDVLARGNVRHAASALVDHVHGDAQVARRPADSRMGRQVIPVRRLIGRTNLHVQRVVEREGVHDGEHLMATIGAALTHSQEEVHLGRRHRPHAPRPHERERAPLRVTGRAQHVDGQGLVAHLFLLLAKNSFSSPAHSSRQTPGVTENWWLRRSSSCTAYSVPRAPAFWSDAP